MTLPCEKIIIELYSYLDTAFSEDSDNNADCSYETAQMAHEVLANYEIACALRKDTHPKTRYIYALHHKLAAHIKSLDKGSEIINLAPGTDLGPNQKLANVSQVVLVAQGNVDAGEVAGLAPDALAEALQEDMEILCPTDLQLISCKIGQSDDYMTNLAEFLGAGGWTTKITCYTGIVSAHAEGKVIVFEEDSDGACSRVKDLSSMTRYFWAKQSTQD